MPVLHITKRYNKRSPRNGIIVKESVEFGSYDDGLSWLAAVPLAKGLDYEIIDYDWSLTGQILQPEIIENPTGGLVGKIPKP